MDRWWGVQGVSDQGAGADEWRVGWVGDEEVPVVHSSVQSPIPQKCSAKNKERAVEGVDMFVGDAERRERSREIQSLCCFLLLFIFRCFFILSFTMDAHFLSLGTRNF